MDCDIIKADTVIYNGMSFYVEAITGNDMELSKKGNPTISVPIDCPGIRTKREMLARRDNITGPECPNQY